MKPHLVLIAVPSLGHWHARFGQSLAAMTARFMGHGNVPKGVSVCSVVGSILPNQRSDAVKAARECDATHLLFIDSDMEFPPTLLDEWLAYDKDIIAANCAIKSFPSQPTARNKKGNKWVPVYTGPNSSGLEKVDRIGTGIMLLKMSVFDKIEQPYFEMRWLEEMQGYQGEDWCFVEKIEKAGIPIYIDHTISREVYHVGEFRYSHRQVKPELLLVSEEDDPILRAVNEKLTGP